MYVKLLILVILLVFVPVVYAGDSPILVSPTDNSPVTSSTLNWQAPSYQLYLTNPYRVQVDDDSTFSSLNKDYYTKNNYYTPLLTPEVWFWRVKAKDSAGTWSVWSDTWSFNLSSSTPAPSSTPTLSPTPPPSSAPASSSSSFIISDIPSEINSDQSFNVSISLSLSDNPNTNFYLKGAFKKSASSNYFGQTLVSGNWVKNNSTYSNQFPITTNSLGNWSGNLEIKPDSEDTGFIGTGDYIFKFGRYTSIGFGPTWSNEITVRIISISSDNQGDSTTSENSTPATNPSISPQIQDKPTSSVKSKSYKELVYHTASVAAATTSANPTSGIQIENQQEPNFILWIGLGLVISGIGSLIFIYLRGRNLHEEIYHWFRRRN